MNGKYNKIFFAGNAPKLILGERKEICLEQDMVLHERTFTGEGEPRIVSAHM